MFISEFIIFLASYNVYLFIFIGVDKDSKYNVLDIFSDPVVIAGVASAGTMLIIVIALIILICVKSKKLKRLRIESEEAARAKEAAEEEERQRLKQLRKERREKRDKFYLEEAKKLKDKEDAEELLRMEYSKGEDGEEFNRRNEYTFATISLVYPEDHRSNKDIEMESSSFDSSIRHFNDNDSVVQVSTSSPPSSRDQLLSGDEDIEVLKIS